MTCPHGATQSFCPACLLALALAPIEPGTILNDRFRILELIGRGGMGEVYRAEDVKLGQQVALKFVRFANDDMRGQLLDEVRYGREVAHPNVCRIYDVVDLEGEAFIVMEYVEGQNLASLLPMPPVRAKSIARQICEGVAASHDRGVIHGDLKPANVMIDRTSRARIMDFGLASLARESAKGKRIAGTPAYMAPEQREGKLDAKSDLYALGGLLRDLFGGRAPREIAAMIERCLAADPRHRPESAHEILSVLPADDAVLFDEPRAIEGASPWPLFFAIILGLGLILGFKGFVSIERDSRLSADALEARARAMAPPPDADHASWFEGPPLVFRYRQSATPMVSRDPDARVTSSEPPPGASDTLITLTPSGTLSHYAAAEREPPISYKLYLLLLVPLLGAAALMARTNMRSGRVDVKGARRVALWAAICRMIYALLEAHHVSFLADEAQILGTGLSRSVLVGIEVWLGYLAVESYIRRRRPRAIEAWTRLVHGQFGDPLVGRDVLSGVAYGTAMALVACADRIDSIEPLSAALHMLSSRWSTISHFFYFQTRAIFYALFAAVLLVALRSMIKPKWLGSVVWIVTATFVFTQSRVTPLHVAACAILAALLLAAIARAGMLAAAMALFVYLLILATPLPVRLFGWFLMRSGVILLLLSAIVVWATTAATGRLRRAL